jgi:hypothetical protein
MWLVSVRRDWASGVHSQYVQYAWHPLTGRIVICEWGWAARSRLVRAGAHAGCGKPIALPHLSRAPRNSDYKNTGDTGAKVNANTHKRCRVGKLITVQQL